jgi:serine protease Do
MRLGLSVLSLALLAAAGFAQPAPRPGGRNAQVLTPASTPYLGIGARDVDPDGAKRLNLKEVRGSEVTSVTPDSPAAKAGLHEGDVILEFNGQPVEGNEQLSRMVRETPIGRQVKLGIWRDGKNVTLTATIEAHKGGMQSFSFNGPWQAVSPEQWGEMQDKLHELPIPDWNTFAMPGAGLNTPMLGIMGEPLGQEKQFADYFGVEDGVLVKSVTHGSAADKAGLKAGDVILKIDDTHISNTRDIGMALRSAKAKKTVNVQIVRNHKEMTLPVTIEAPGLSGGAGSPVRA